MGCAVQEIFGCSKRHWQVPRRGAWPWLQCRLMFHNTVWHTSVLPSGATALAKAPGRLKAPAQGTKPPLLVLSMGFPARGSQQNCMSLDHSFRKLCLGLTSVCTWWVDAAPQQGTTVPMCWSRYK